MTDLPEPPEDRVSASGIASIERAFLRLTFWQTLLSLAGVFTGAVALYAALGESAAVRQQTAATVWPYLQVIINDYVNEDDAQMSLEINNVGVGPARLRSVQLTIDGHAYEGWDDIFAHFMGGSTPEVEYGRSSLRGRVLAPAETLTFFSTRDREIVLAMQEAIYGGAITLSYCYCSIFDECWLVQIQRDPEPEPRSVEHCPDYGEDSFKVGIR